MPEEQDIDCARTWNYHIWCGAAEESLTGDRSRNSKTFGESLGVICGHCFIRKPPGSNLYHLQHVRFDSQVSSSVEFSMVNGRKSNCKFGSLRKPNLLGIC